MMAADRSTKKASASSSSNSNSNGQERGRRAGFGTRGRLNSETD
jgi:hypothetical protein